MDAADGGRWRFDVAAGLLCLLALVPAWRVASDLTWPCESDLYRDLGAAQSLLDGGFRADPGYLGERWWYPPLLPAVVALASVLTGVPLHQAYSSFGPLLNLAGPLAFYAMLAMLFDRRVALGGLTAFLFLGHNDLYGWLHATYSPWLWACNFAQALHYAALLTLVQMLRRGSVRLAVGGGLLWGLTLLGHVAQGMILAGIVVAAVAASAVRDGLKAQEFRRTLKLGVVATFVAAAVSAPFWIDVVGRQVVNPVPLTWVPGELALPNWRDPVRRLLTLRGVFAGLGLAWLFVGSRDFDGPSRLGLIAWAVAALLGLGYGYAAQAWPLPPLLPSWHFYFSLQALESALFGLGLVGVTRVSWRLMCALRPAPWQRTGGQELVYGLLASAVLVLVATRYERYQVRLDLMEPPKVAKRIARSGGPELHAWILARTRPGDVLLADDWTAFSVVRAAGRKVVFLPDLFSSPYVDNAPRKEAMNELFKLLHAGDGPGFARLARPHNVKFVVVPATKRANLKGNELVRLVKKASKKSGFDVYDYDQYR